MYFIPDLRVEGVPSEVVVVRSKDGGEFNEGKLGKLCRESNIKQRFTTAGSPEYNGVAKRGLAMIESASPAARIRASELFPGCNVPEGLSLLAGVMSWACDARTAPAANPGTPSLYEMF